MAATLDEIRNCPVKNYEFWTSQARFFITCAKANKDNPNPFWYRRHLSKAREALQGRRDQQYLKTTIDTNR